MKFQGPVPVKLMVTVVVDVPSLQIEPPPVTVAVGAASIIIVAEDDAVGQAPEAAIVLVTEYVPGELVAKLTRPVPEFITNPVVELNVPALAPLTKLGAGFEPVVQ